MKLVKLSVFALTMGLFVASCGNGGGEAAKTDTAAVAPAPTAEPAPAAAPAPTDSAAATAAPAPAGDAKMEAKPEEKKK